MICMRSQDYYPDTKVLIYLGWGSLTNSYLLLLSDERPFLLRDKQFETKYKVRVADVVEKARQRPHSLLQGYYLYPTRHVQPPLTTIVRLAQTAGARVRIVLKTNYQFQSCFCLKMWQNLGMQANAFTGLYWWLWGADQVCQEVV